VILDRSKLELLNKEVLIIDLASKPGGVDRDAANDLRIKTIWALALPGKVAPQSAAQIIKHTIEHELL
jgi:dipicolinate synthase subunit A